MKEKPIIFNGPMVRAILEGRKTQTRRPVKHVGNAMHYGKILGAWSLSKPPRKYVEGEMPWRWMGKKQPKVGDWIWELQTDVDDTATFPLSAYQAGDRLWVRETWWDIQIPSPRELREGADTWPKVAFPATDDDPQYRKWGWIKRPSIHMPRWASRITLEVTGVRVERVQEITEEGAVKEGVDSVPSWHEDGTSDEYFYAEGFRRIWDSLYPGSWERNEWVWVIEFRRVKP